MKKIITIIVTVFALFGIVVYLVKSPVNQSSVSKQSSGSNTSYQTKNNNHKIVVSINGKRLKAHLNQSSAAKSFYQELPKTLNFRDYANMPEKVADLDHTLPTTGMPKGHTGTKGTIGYWSPEKRIVFYWGTESYYEGIHIIGYFDSSNYRKIIKNMGNNIDVQIMRDK